MGCAISAPVADPLKVNRAEIIRDKSIIIVHMSGRQLKTKSWFLNDPTTIGNADQYNPKTHMESFRTYIINDNDNFTLMIDSRLYKYSSLTYVQRHGIYTVHGKYYFDIDSFLKYGKFPLKCKYDRTELTDVKIILHTFTDYHMIPFTGDQKTDRTFTLWTAISNVKMPKNLTIKSLTFKSAIDRPIIEYQPIEKVV